jgi:uncharacterized coiled-coil protein SlyX
MEERITELELRSMQQEALLQELSEVLATQQRTLDAVRAQVEALRQRIPEPAVVDVTDERPPHY